MTDYPITDEAEDRCRECGLEFVPKDFARSLEIRLREAEERAAKMETIINQKLWENPLVVDPALIERAERAEAALAEAQKPYSGELTAAMQTLKRQAAQIAKLEKDAARYRWLCINGRWRADWWKRFVTHEELSAAIDAALSPFAPVNPPVKEELDKRPD
jgi:hypothetical protein